MLRPFLVTAMRAPARHVLFRRTVTLHALVLTGLASALAQAATPATLSVIGQILLVLGILEGGALIGWRLTQIPKSQALEFLLVSPVQPRRVLLAEALVGIGRFTLVCFAGLPLLLALVLAGVVMPLDLWPLAVMPFIWGVVAGLGLTVWAYEPHCVRRVGEAIGLVGVLVYLVVGILAGENLKVWLALLPPAVADWCLRAVLTLHHGNPFGVVRNWFTLSEGPATAWPLFVEVNILGGVLAFVFALRAAFRLKGHFHDEHYRPIDSKRIDQCRHIGRRPLSWWAIRRVMKYSGRVNVWLAGGFCFLYSAFIIAGNHWPAWMGRLVFQIFDAWGGPPVVATAMCVLAAVPAAFQYGLWDSTISSRCQRLELLLLTELNSYDYWRASLAAAWRRGYDYLIFAGLLWVSLAISGRAAWVEAVAAAFGGLLLWSFSFAVGFRAFSTGRQSSGLASALTLGLPLLLVVLVRANLESIAAFIPTAACYLPLRIGVTESWAAGVAVTLAATIWLTDRGLSCCDRELRCWYDANQGRKTE
jgi:hypothetical protein